MEGDISQLKSLALSLNEELKHLHSKQLFTNFKTNQIEFLLEEIKNGKFDEEKLKLQKRVEWHILNSVTIEVRLIQVESVEKIEDFCEQNKSENYQHPHFSVESAKSKENITSHGEDHKLITLKKYQERNKDFRLSSARSDDNVPLQKPILKETSPNSRLKEYRRSLTGRRVKLIDNSDKYTNKISKLELTLNPCINIPPLSRSSLPSVNIKSRRDLPQSLAYIPSSAKIEHSPHENYSDMPLPLQKVQNASIHILPLSKQMQPSLTLLPKKRKSVLNNQAFITCHHSQVLSEDTDPNLEETINSFNISEKKEEYKEAVSVSDSIFQASENHSREINEYNSLSEKSYDSRPSPVITNRYKIRRQIDGQIKQKDFDSIRFINRLEERLGSVLISLPTTKFIGKKLENQQKECTKSVDAQTSPNYFEHELVCNKGLRNLQGKLNDASSQAGSSSIKKFTKDEFIQTCLPEAPNSKKNAEEQYNSSSFESDENTEDNESSQIYDEEKEEAVSDEKWSEEEPLGSIHDAEQDLRKESSMDHSNDGCNLEHAVEPHSREEYKEKGLRNKTLVEKNSSKSELFKNSEASLEDKENSPRESIPSSRDSKPDFKDTEGLVNEDLKILVPEENSLVEYVSELELNFNNNEITCSSVEEKSNIVSINERPDAETISEDPTSKSLEVNPSDGFRHAENSSQNSDGANNFGSHEFAAVEETNLPSIEIGDVTISDGEIEFEASISDIQPGNRIAIKFSTRDFGNFSNRLNYSRTSCQLVNKETQTNLTDSDSDVVQHSSFSDGVLLLQSDKDISLLNDISEENEETTVNFSDGEILGKESPLPEVFIDPKEKETIQRENRMLRERLANFTGRFCIK